MTVILFILLGQTVQLEKVDHSRIMRFETTRDGHFMIDLKGRSFHWAHTGALLFELDREKRTVAMHKVPGGYAVTWVEPKSRRYGIEILDNLGNVRQELVDVASWWFLNLHGKLYGSARIWAKGETQLVPVSFDKGRIAPTTARSHYFDPGSLGAPMDGNYKRVWAVEQEEHVILATPLEPVLYTFKDGVYEKRTTLEIPWQPWKIMYRASGYKDHISYMKTFSRITYFGTVLNGYVVSVENPDQKI